ncbi:MAG: hypothetical protein LEGION0403_FIIPPAGN_02452 [Legionella sp.]|uniref:hypothetical protein n=1 Tax=Legionella sp. TaxID=459 RepID=UPI003D0A5F95
MLSTSEAVSTLDEEKTRRIIELYLRARFKEGFSPAWLDTMDNYAPLAKALTFFDRLANDNLKLAAIGSSNEGTREDHKAQFLMLQDILEDVAPLSDDIPPVAREFNEKDAVLWSLELNQHLESRSLRDLHAQNSNLGIVEKLLNGELGEEEWLGEVDLERMLIKLGVKDRTHITRLNAEDIGMILHFERVKHDGSTAPYTIPLLINCGSGSTRSQGSHWTYAMVSVNPTTNSVTINYQDSMPLRGPEGDILTAAINYSDGAYNAFSTYATQTVNTNSNGLQKDGWSCGYRALRGLITAPGFPVTGNVTQGVPWQRLVGVANNSTALCQVVYDELLDGVDIDRQYAEDMALDPSMFTSTSEKYLQLDSKFAQHYRELLGGRHGVARLGASENFAEDYRKISIMLSTIRVSTSRVTALKELKRELNEVITNNDLSSDEKLFAILNVMGTEYSKILNSFRGSNSVLADYIKEFCDKQMGVVLDKDPLYRFKKDGLMSRMLDNQAGIKLERNETESLLPPVKKKTTDIGVSHSAPTVRTTKPVETRVTPSEGSIDKKGARLNQTALREREKDARLGTMFGLTQFCYGQKPSGVEPGFRAIDLNKTFFKELSKILSKVPSENDPHHLHKLGAALDNVEDLKRKQEIFSVYINTHTPKPYAESTKLNPGVQWLCEEIKKAVASNHNLQAWMYKLDYAEGQKERIKANKEAIREFVGTRLAGIFSEQNQKQELAWVNNKDGGAHALLACGWKNGLRELTDFLCNGKEPDYRGVLVENKDAPLKQSMLIPGLAKNLIFGVAIGDRDGIGKNAQNKGFADGAFYGFDYGKPYEGDGVCDSLNDDFSFDDFYAKAPAFLRRETAVGLARHMMYRNYSVFYDTPLSERMVGLHLLRKMITGENPDEEVIKSNPGLRQELHRIQESTPTPKSLLRQLDLIRHNCSNPKTMALLEAHVMAVGSGKLSNFDLYFYKIKTDIMEMAVKSGMPYEELSGYIKFIDKMASQAYTNNSRILKTFAQRIPLTRQELDLLDNLEKFCSPTSIMSADGEVFLNRLRFEPQDKRIPFQLKHEDNGTYTLSTTNKFIAKTIEKEFGLVHPSVSKGGVSYALTQDQLSKLMVIADQKYNEKVQKELFHPTYKATVLKRVLAMINSDNTPETPKAGFAIKWEDDGRLSIRLEAKTTEQAGHIRKILGLHVMLNETETISIHPRTLQVFKEKVDALYVRDGYASRTSAKSKVDDTGIELCSIVKTVSEPSSGSEKWKALHQKEHELTPTEQLMKRFETLVTKTDVLVHISDILAEARPDVVEQLMQYNNNTLSNEDNLNAIIQDRLGDIKEIPDELVITSTTPSNVRPGLQ